MKEGLSEQEVQDRIRRGQINRSAHPMTRTRQEIIKGNVLTYFNLINAVLFTLVLITGKVQNGLFFVTIVFNALIGIAQELKAKQILDQLFILVVQDVEVCRNGCWQTVKADRIVLNDRIRIKNGMLFTHVRFTWALLMLPFILLCLFLFCLGVGMILAALTVYFRDMMHLYTVLTTAWMYMTPIFWTIDIMPEKYFWIIRLNPMYHYITYFRNLVLAGIVPPLHTHLLCLAMSLAALLIGDYIFEKLQKNFILYI